MDISDRSLRLEVKANYLSKREYKKRKRDAERLSERDIFFKDRGYVDSPRPVVTDFLFVQPEFIEEALSVRNRSVSQIEAKPAPMDTPLEEEAHSVCEHLLHSIAGILHSCSFGKCKR